MDDFPTNAVERSSDWRHSSFSLGHYQAVVDSTLAEMEEARIIPRIWDHDHTVWKPEPTEITNRLGWLRIADDMRAKLGRLEEFAHEVRRAGFSHVLLLGMGGSSLAPEVFGKTFGDVDGLSLSVLDSTDPAAVLAQAEALESTKTLFIVATKSGGTVETISFCKFFYNRVQQAVGAEQVGGHFVAISDPGSELETLAREYGFREIFMNDPSIGGRYSVLSYFGLVPAALVGVDVGRLLDRAQAASAAAGPSVEAGANLAAHLGLVLGELSKTGRDKATFAISPAVASFGDWVEQLIAESTGKEGVGVLPVVGEPIGSPEVYGDDRLFIHLRLTGDDTHDDQLAALEAAGCPVVRIDLQDEYDLGGQFFLWEFATAVAGHRLSVNPFDQPNVEAAKVLAREMVAAYAETGALPDSEAALLTAEALTGFLAQAGPGDYIALQAYLPPTPETDTALAALRLRLRDRYRLATTVGYGPRFLHSTGQLHKGDGGNGLFIQFTADDRRDAPIPDAPGSAESSISFGVLKMAQSLGDYRALLEAGRRVVRFHLGDDVAGALGHLVTLLG